MVFSIFWPFTPTLSSTFLCDIFLSISTSVRRKLAWDIFWHDLPLEGLLKWTNQRSLISNVALLCLMRFKRQSWFFVSWLWSLVWVTINRLKRRKWIFRLHWTPTLTLPKLVCHEKCDSFVTTANKCSSLFQDLQAIQCVAQIVRQIYKRSLKIWLLG